MTNFNVGDNGQQYEHHCKDHDGRDVILGWSNIENDLVFIRLVDLHPVWKNYNCIDRKGMKR